VCTGKEARCETCYHPLPMRLSDFHFDLPESRIAQYPLAERSASRLLVLDAAANTLEHTLFSSLSCHLRAGDILVMNDTRVIPARLFGRKETGGKVEILLERVLDQHRVLTRIRASKSPKPGTRLFVDVGAAAQGSTECALVQERQGEFFVLVFAGRLAADIINDAGHVPLPPYIKRAADAADSERYQTVYARHNGAVAAPTAGLHFDAALLARLNDLGVKQAFVTLHIGAGTFQPLRQDDISQHVMHTETVDVSRQAVEAIENTRAEGGRVIAVGTTSVRSLESAAVTGNLQAWSGETRLFIKPGDRFRVVDAMITNFHLPASTLLLLVAAFAGRQQILDAYRTAIDRQYRFFSYGDAMLLWPDRAAWQHEIQMT